MLCKIMSTRTISFFFFLWSHTLQFFYDCVSFSFFTSPQSCLSNAYAFAMAHRNSCFCMCASVYMHIQMKGGWGGWRINGWMDECGWPNNATGTCSRNPEMNTNGEWLNRNENMSTYVLMYMHISINSTLV